MAINELAWRKFPRDTMRNEDLDYCSYLLPENLKAAPFLFFTTAFCKCDDDGVFDLENGVIFSRLMRLGSPADVLHIAELLAERKIITRILPDANVYMISDWETPTRPGSYSAKNRTMEDRRKAVALKIEAERRSQMQQAAAIPVNFAATPQPDASFFSVDVDKNCKNVDRQRERERENREIETHTQKENREQTDRQTDETRERSSSLRANDALRPAAAEQSTAETQIQQSQENTKVLAEAALAGSNTAAVTASVSKSEKQSADETTIRDVLNTFFAKNCLGYSAAESDPVIKTLAERLAKLTDTKNPAGIVASVFCTQFKSLSETPGHFQNVPITPQMLFNSSVYAQVCSRASKVLLTQGHNDEWEKQQKQELLEVEADRSRVYDEIKNDCLKYHIDINDPQRMFKIMLAKKQEKERLNE